MLRSSHLQNTPSFVVQGDTLRDYFGMDTAQIATLCAGTIVILM